MQTKQYKDHILFEPEQDEKLSNLGLKAAYRQERGILSLRKIYKNGKLNIICDTLGFKKAQTQSMTEKQIAMFFKALAELLCLCDESAFLDHTYIEISEDMLFISEANGEFCFAMVPVDSPDYSAQYRLWDEKIKTLISQLLVERHIYSLQLGKFRDGLADTQNIVAYIRDNAFTLNVEEMESDVACDCLELAYYGPYGTFSFYITKDEFVIGKSSDCDGVLSMNPTVSRHHCAIRRTGNVWTITDIGSSNGTYLDGLYLAPNQMNVLKNNSRIRISDMEFWVKMEM